MNAASEALRFIHLADIHFRGSSGIPTDLDRDIRNELVKDAQSLLNRDLVTGILVCGDIAWSGREAEYQVAANWLAQLCEELQCAKEFVWTVPGNHDVDRKTIESSRTAQSLRKMIRQMEIPVRRSISICWTTRPRISSSNRCRAITSSLRDISVMSPRLSPTGTAI